MAHSSGYPVGKWIFPVLVMLFLAGCASAEFVEDLDETFKSALLVNTGSSYADLERAHRDALENAYQKELSVYRDRQWRASQVAMKVQLSLFYLNQFKDYARAVKYAEEALTMVKSAEKQGPQREPDAHFRPYMSEEAFEAARGTYGGSWVDWKKKSFYEEQKSWALFILDQAHGRRAHEKHLTALEDAIKAVRYRRQREQGIRPTGDGAQARPTAPPRVSASTVAQGASAAAMAAGGATAAALPKPVGPNSALPTPVATADIGGSAGTRMGQYQPVTAPQVNIASGTPTVAQQVLRPLTPSAASVAPPPPPPAAAPPASGSSVPTGRVDFAAITDVKAKKRAFFNHLRPAVQAINHDIRAKRRRIEKIWEKAAKTGEVDAAGQNWLAQLSTQYGLDGTLIESDQYFVNLLKRVDVVPVSMALAQAAHDSAWGTSRFARLGNNFFSMKCNNPGCGIVPLRRDPGVTNEVAKYGDVTESVGDYIRYINTHDAYGQLRDARSKLRMEGRRVSGAALVPGLGRYTERGEGYVKIIQKLIRYNHLDELD